jgi:arylsulfatase A-like enzyme
MPGGDGARRSNCLIQPADIMPTLLELAGADDPGTMHGKSLLRLLKGSDKPLRDIAVSSWAIIHEPKERAPLAADPYTWFEQARGIKPSTINDGEWALICGARDVPPELYHLPSDLAQARNVFAEHKDEARRLHAAYVQFLESVGTNPEFVDRRRELPEG